MTKCEKTQSGMNQNDIIRYWRKKASMEIRDEINAQKNERFEEIPRKTRTFVTLGQWITETD